MPPATPSRSAPDNGRRSESKPDTRERIIRHAIKLFAANGYTNTSLDDIATAVGIRKPSLYHYIQTKEDLLYEIHKLLAQEALNHVNELLANAVTPEQKVRAFFRGAMRLVADRQEEMTIFLSEIRSVERSEKRWREIAVKRDNYQKLFEAVLAEGIAGGVFRDLPVSQSALGMLGTVTWAYQWYQANGMPPDEIGDLFADIVLNGMVRPDARG